MALTLNELNATTTYNGSTDLMWTQISGVDKKITINNLMGNTEAILPKTDLTYDIGSPTQRFNAVYADEVFVGASSLYVNGKKVIEDNSDIMTFATDLDQGVTIKTISTTAGSGNGNMSIESGNEIGMLAAGGIEITVPVTVASKDIILSNASAGGFIRLSGDSVAQGNLSITGNLTVSGTMTTVDTETVNITDNIILINSSQAGTPLNTLVGGIEIERGDSTNYRFVFEELDDTFKIGEQGSLQAVATREDSPTDGGIAVWNAASNKFNSVTSLSLSDSVTAKGFIAIAHDTGSEGGQINFIGAGSNDNIYIDNYQGNFRFVNSTSDNTMFQVDDNGNGYLDSKRIVTVTSGTTAPTGAGLGDEFYNTTLDEWYKYNGSVWMQI